MPPSGDRNRYRKIWRDGECKIENRLGTTTTGNNNNKPEKTVHNMLSPSLVSLKWSNNNNNSNCTDGVQLLWSPHRYGERTTREREGARAAVRCRQTNVVVIVVVWLGHLLVVIIAF